MCWSPDVLHEMIDRRAYADTGDIEQWRSGSQEGIDPLWKDLGSKIEEQVLGKYEVKESNGKADKGRGEQWRWRVQTEENKNKPCEL